MKTNYYDSNLDYFYQNCQTAMNIERRLLHLLRYFNFNSIFE